MTYSRTVQLPVTPDEAFALITEPERLRRWQAVSASVDLRVGGDYRWTVTPGHLAGGTFREVVPGKQVVFGWGWDTDTDLPTDASTVTITLEPNADGTAVTLVHEGLSPEQEVGHAEGWNHFLERLETVAATGDAGQDEWAWAPENLDPFVAAEAVLAAIQPVLRGLTAEDQPKQTPCADFTCHDLAEHLFHSLQQLGGMAGGTVTNPEAGSLENRVSVMTDQALTAWRARGLEGTVAGPGGREFPASFFAGILPIELLLHGWDLAQASGQELRVSDELVGYVRELAETVVPGGRGSSFGDEVVAAEGASPVDRLAAFAGRTPIAA
ncbi:MULTISPECIES: TIGR03086 family metal-binding protein [unclassified Nocardioides]|uniref:TIGR03086 family metal-binding protein n=1 Tax=unclassified Nocardioides TaxID=2615069 RepID=UPI0006F21B0C|nr:MULTISPECIES: TIGR03086 family metal-binding protein [unclassified Nocardioides]KQY56875.1 ArsR family transcriptional regulator [Nocardioides sp. Root140]KQZ66929.1 ArsR family transcriptional regulator [Nocardioides sp. Root151]KRF12997.1 ArsR family transcriptional regulator [Nocardioides sp. Soil796]